MNMRRTAVMALGSLLISGMAWAHPDAAHVKVENAWARGAELHLHGWIYGMHDGLLRDLGPHVSSIEGRDALPSIDSCVHHRPEPVTALRRHAISAFAGAPCCECG